MVDTQLFQPRLFGIHHNGIAGSERLGKVRWSLGKAPRPATHSLQLENNRFPARRKAAVFSGRGPGRISFDLRQVL